MTTVAGSTVGVAVIGTTWSDPLGEGSDKPGTVLNYALDAAWSASLVEATRLRNSGNGSVVIGENQGARVIPASLQWGASTINFGQYWIEGRDPTPMENMAGIVYNAGWTVGVMQNKMHIYDIGTEIGRKRRSQNYQIERQMIDLARYPDYEQSWWPGNAGWDYTK